MKLKAAARNGVGQAGFSGQRQRRASPESGFKRRWRVIAANARRAVVVRALVVGLQSLVKELAQLRLKCERRSRFNMQGPVWQQLALPCASDVHVMRRGHL